MKNKVHLFLIAIAIVGLFLGSRSYLESRSVDQETQALKGRLKSLEDKVRLNEKFKKDTPVKLESVYQACVNDLAAAAKTYSLGMVIEGKAPLFAPSTLQGLREARIKVKFSGIPRRGVLVSLLSLLDALAGECPFLAEKVFQDKDSLTVDMVLIGL